MIQCPALVWAMMPLQGPQDYGAPTLQLLWAAEVAQAVQADSGRPPDLAQSQDDARMKTRQPMQHPSETGSLEVGWLDLVVAAVVAGFTTVPMPCSWKADSQSASASTVSRQQRV